MLLTREARLKMGRLVAYISDAGVELHSETSNTHLKQGDKTTRVAAARIYYQAFSLNGVSYVAVLYAGPHPDSDIDCRLHLPRE